MNAVDNDDLAIVRRFPRALAGIPRVRLTNLPTPVDRLRSLEREAGIGEIWVKRDDRSATMYGGNKPRKLEFILDGDKLKGAWVLVRMGGTRNADGKNWLLHRTR